MFEASIRRTPRPQDLVGLSTQALRDTFQITHLFVPGEITGHFTDLDRLVVGGVMPTNIKGSVPSIETNFNNAATRNRGGDFISLLAKPQSSRPSCAPSLRALA